MSTRGLKKRKDRVVWTQVMMDAAVKAVQDGLSVKSAAANNNIPRKTLADYLKRGAPQKLNTGPKLVFTSKQELELVGRITRLQKIGFPLTRDDIRRLAYDLSILLKISNRFGQTSVSSKRAGPDWFRSFMKRHPTLSYRTSETMSYGRGAGLNRTVVASFYELLSETVQKEMLGPQNIFNMDESGLQLTTRAGQVIAEKGSKRIPQLASGEKGKTVSYIACCSATGVFLPPYVIFKGVRAKEEFSDGLPPGSEYTMTDSGYAQAKTFSDFINFFLKHKPAGKTLLILDGHSSHVDLNGFVNAENAGVMLMLLPAHTSHELQPLDKSVFKAIKQCYYTQARAWHAQNPGRCLSKISFSDVFTPAWNKGASRENAVAGFRAIGIYPLNPNSISDSAFAPSDVSDRPLTVPSMTPIVSDCVPPVIPQLPSDSSLSNPALVLPDDKDHEPSTSVEGLPSQVETPSKLQSSLMESSFSSLTETPKIVRKITTRPSINKKAILLSLENMPKPKALKTKLPKADKKTKMNPVCLKPNVTSKKNQGKKRQAKNTNAAQVDTEPCANCGRLYDDPDFREFFWVQCLICKLWYHEICDDSCHISGTCDKCRTG